MQVLAAGLTDIGKKRKTNQDAIYLNLDKNFFIVADGMGGHNGGDIASAMAVKCIPEYLTEHYLEDPIQIMRNCIRYANAAIHKKAKHDLKLEGMGTTSVALLFKHDTRPESNGQAVVVYLANVGDSRCYLVNSHQLYQMSSDHSLVQEKLALSIIAGIGEYTRENAAFDPQKNIIVRTVGFEENVEVDVFTYKVSKNDMLLICSDGLHGRVSDRDILYTINTHVPNPSGCTNENLQTAVKALIDLANHNGGNDNISVILVLAK
ncbi:MAG: Stp1/IreP family PP2C-type Ser/Thr phosphatase [Bdellovibrionota bacterium]